VPELYRDGEKVKETTCAFDDTNVAGTYGNERRWLPGVPTRAVAKCRAGTSSDTQRRSATLDSHFAAQDNLNSLHK
jgi:hypothetical protein